MGDKITRRGDEKTLKRSGFGGCYLSKIGSECVGRPMQTTQHGGRPRDEDFDIKVILAIETPIHVGTDHVPLVVVGETQVVPSRVKNYMC